MGRIWDEETVLLLIRTMKTHEHIWNPDHPHYTRNKRIRHDSWKDITRAFNKSCPDLNFKPAELCSKWNNLRLSFQKENKKSSALGRQNSRWKYYDMLTFLTDHLAKKHEAALSTPLPHNLRRARLKRETIDETEDISIGSISPYQTKTNQSSIDSFSAGICTVIPANSQGRIEMGSAFGDYVAAEMRQLETDLQMRAKKVIFNVLMELQREQEIRKCS